MWSLIKENDQKKTSDINSAADGGGRKGWRQGWREEGGRCVLRWVKVERITKWTREAEQTRRLAWKPSADPL